MAMELFVLSDKQLSSIEEWQSAIEGEGYPLRLDGETAFPTIRGFLPVRLRGADTGFECDHWPATEFMHELPRTDFGHDWKFVLAFRWSGDFNEWQAAWMAGTAYAVATNGVIFDDQEGKVRTASEGRQVVREIEEGLPKMEAILRDLKRP